MATKAATLLPPGQTICKESLLIVSLLGCVRATEDRPIGPRYPLIKTKVDGAAACIAVQKS